MTPQSTPEVPGYPGGQGPNPNSPCYSPITTKQNFKVTFFDSTNGLGAHKGQRRTHTDATIVILVLDTRFSALKAVHYLFNI